MYESPIEIIQGEMHTEYENGILRAVQKYGIRCNKEELIKALAYDRNQYQKGFEDGRPKWIPCSERLPEENQGVFLTVETVYGHRDVLPSIATYHKGLWWWFDNDELGNNVIAWMPLPEPWKGEE